ncbi:MAG: zf-TFIIB domain-containing protein [Ignavibacteriaceae bacterium]
MPVKPSEKEEEYFARLEFDRRKKQEEEARIKLEEAEKERLKNLHYMQCPKCGMKLIEINYKDIQVDKCSSCDGVWLDAGELDAISNLEKGKLDKLFGVFKK